MRADRQNAEPAAVTESQSRINCRNHTLMQVLTLDEGSWRHGLEHKSNGLLPR
jgi:hypothetical protein